MNLKILCVLLTISSQIFAQENKENQTPSKKDTTQEIEQNIKPDIKENDVKLFIDKIEIEGRLEKPQAVFILPGQTPEIDDIPIERSFLSEIFRPVEKKKTVETKYAPQEKKMRKDVIEW